jgi:hypothetical protein
MRAMRTGGPGGIGERTAVWANVTAERQTPAPAIRAETKIFKRRGIKK